MKKFISLLILITCVLGLWLPAHAATNTKLDALVAKIDRLETYVFDNNWQEIRTFIRGPLGEVRREVAQIQRTLNPSQRSALKASASKFFNDLIDLDFAALNQNPERTEAAFRSLRNDLNQMLDSLD
jgi:photosystem II protein PsbQ